ncbi:DUF2235 domain-containing protein [Bradyrhizobium liaoningense]|nr:DUF2235 domain-containing protein [Bradyrhizobium liaoningense]
MDGTWNDADFGPTDTNIVRLREIIAKCLEDGSSGKSDTAAPSNSRERTAVARGKYKSGASSKDHLVFYERGVGTGGLLDRFFGGAFGAGLGRSIRRAYNFLAANYDDGDEVFVFGFSRGSFTARSLVGLISSAGLLRSDACTLENQSRLWSYYRTNALDRTLPARRSWDGLVYPAFNFSCLGVFDTVGALGIPLPTFWHENRDLFEFHDVGLSQTVKLNLHALAIDEHRLSFEPALWRKPKFGKISAPTEQVWFVGAHSDIGGGYVDEERRKLFEQTALDDLSLDWMLRRVLHHCHDFPVYADRRRGWNVPVTGKELADCSFMAARHEARKHFYRLVSAAQRSIGNVRIDVGFRERVVARDRHAEVINEKIHVSAIERLGRPVQVRPWAEYYAPKNLLALLKAARFDAANLIPIVDYEGNDLGLIAANLHLAEAKDRLERVRKL